MLLLHRLQVLASPGPLPGPHLLSGRSLGMLFIGTYSLFLLVHNAAYPEGGVAEN
ncbi:hypothetical protein Tco_0416594, partial [Tanacetum coccineum]